MKKLCFFLFSVFAILSCSNDTTDQNPDNTNLLQRVDFHPGLTIERRWNFNTDGLLSSITKADGTVVQSFTYDANNRLISSTIFNEVGANQTYTFTYNNNDFVTSVNGQALTYDLGLDGYYIGDLSQNYRLTQINSEKLIVYGKTAYSDFDENGNPYEVIWDEIFVNYTPNNNLVSFSPNDSCNTMTYDNATNPLRSATLAICRAFSFVENSPWINGHYNSVNNPLSHNYCSEDPESEVFNYTYNTDQLPVTMTRDNYYLGVYENTTTFAKFYYQGDILP